MGKLSSILLGTVSGVAAALFLTSDKGKQVRSQAQEFLEDLKEDPEYAKEQVCEKFTCNTNSRQTCTSFYSF